MDLPPGTEFVVGMTATGLTLTPAPPFPTVTAREVRGFLAKRGRCLADDDADIRVRIQARLKLRDDANQW